MREFIVGDEASEYRSMLNVNYPMEHGIVSEKDIMFTKDKYTNHKNNIIIIPTIIYVT